MAYDPLAYEMPWRPNYEMRAVCGWLFAAAAALAGAWIGAMPAAPFYWMAALCALMIVVRLPAALGLFLRHRRLRGRRRLSTSLAALRRQVRDFPREMWLGRGFDWETRHAQRVAELLKRDWKSFGGGEAEAMGQSWIHGVETREKPLRQPLAHAEGHTLIVGATGAGKTRMFDILIAQAVFRGEAVIIIDPKGDHGMRDNARRACLAMGCPQRFVFFHPVFPEESARIDPLRNFTRVTEIASRLAALIPSESGADPFKSFSWQALNNIAQALVITHERPNLIKLRRFLEGGSAQLVVKAVRAWATRVMPDWERAAARHLEKAKTLSREKQALVFARLYHEVIAPEHPNPDLEGLLSMFRHDQTHFTKMVASLLPVMNMLTSGELGPLLSPRVDDPDDPRPVTDAKRIIDKAQVAYLGLDALTDAMGAAALGSLFLSDLAAVAGDRYNHGLDNRPVNIFVDEAAEVVNEPFLQLLNKGRGAKLRLFVATQTIADFAARLGDRNKAMRVLGNVNNIFALRVLDGQTQQYIAENLPKTRLRHVVRSQGSATAKAPLMHGGSQGERLEEKEADLFPAGLLGMLPNLEYIAKISGGRIVKGRLPILRERHE